MSSSNVTTFSGLKTATTNDQPCGVLMTVAPLSCHWVVSVGWREYSTGTNYVRIVTGWEDSANNFSLWGDPLIWSMTKYSM